MSAPSALRPLVLPDGSIANRPIAPEPSSARDTREKEVQSDLACAVSAYKKACEELIVAEVNLGRAIQDQKSSVDDLGVSDDMLMLKNSLIERSRTVYSECQDAKEKAFRQLDDLADRFQNTFRDMHLRSMERLKQEMAGAIIAAGHLGANARSQSAVAAVYAVLRFSQPLIELGNLAPGSYTPRNRPMWEAPSTVDATVEYAEELLAKYERMLQFTEKL
jgi:hypothetical protein